MKNSKQSVVLILKKAGIELNGSNPWDIQVHNDKFYQRILGGGSLALGESYMDGWWSCEKLDIFFEKLLNSNIKESINLNLLLLGVKSKITNMQSILRASQVCEKHYDLDNDLYQRMLDKRMVYTCAYWKDAKTLDEAQEAKLDLICKKIHLKKGDRVLDIGCGYGSFAKFAAEKYEAEVVGITISKEQLKLAQENTKGLSVEIKFQDYRDINGEFDKIVSIGMFEAVGYKNYRNFMILVKRVLKDNGLFLLHTIGQNKSSTTGNPWANKYIFRNGMLPSIKQIGKSSEKLMVMEDWHNFGPDYNKTLIEWDKNFRASWPEIKNKYDDRFYRMWRYYLLSFAGCFKSRHIQLWQIVFSKGDIKEVYEAVR